MSHKSPRTLPSIERINELLRYDPDDPARPVIRIKRAGIGSHNIKPGERAGTVAKTGYAALRIDGVLFKMHRLVWLMHGNDLISGMVIDHIDDNPSNNLIDNLQQITNAQNLQRSQFKERASTAASKYRGVMKKTSGKHWGASISVVGKSKWLGAFDSEDDAARAARAQPR